MRLAVVAFPELDPEAVAAVESFRARHDPMAQRIQAHFTLVFPAEADALSLAAEIRLVAASSAPVDITLADICVSTGIDGRSYVLLESVGGRPSIEKMHDRLYSGMLADQLRYDVEYVPHVTLAVSEDPEEAARLADSLLTSWSPVSGRIVELVLLDLEHDPFRAVEVFSLGG